MHEMWLWVKEGGICQKRPKAIVDLWQKKYDFSTNFFPISHLIVQSFLGLGAFFIDNDKQPSTIPNEIGNAPQRGIGHF
jgi:hypothetical protein